MTDSNGNLSVVGSGDDLGDGTDDVRFVNASDDLILEFLRYEVTAVRVNTFGENIVERLFTAKVSAEILLVFVRRSAGLGLFGVCGVVGNGLINRLVQLGIQSILT